MVVEGSVFPGAQAHDGQPLHAGSHELFVGCMPFQHARSSLLSSSEQPPPMHDCVLTAVRPRAVTLGAAA